MVFTCSSPFVSYSDYLKDLLLIDPRVGSVKMIVIFKHTHVALG